ncbi:MAG: CHAD domain-containing protein [Chthonomonadales bacterium]|nr:CHAD domain-containing protein [Chthonomonadales bacterium]
MKRDTIVYGVDPDGTIADNAQLIIAARVHELIECEGCVRHPEQVVELHRMRIAAKRLRYTLEIFEPALGKAVLGAIQAMKEVQELLGAIHDLDVLTPLLVDELRRVLRPGEQAETWQSVDYAGAVGLASLCRRKHAQRRSLHRQFVRAWRQLRKTGVLDELCGGETTRPAQEVSHALVS